MDAGLRLQHREITVEIEHAAVRVAQESEAGAAEVSFHFRGSEPFGYFFPGAYRFGAMGTDFIRERYPGRFFQT